MGGSRGLCLDGLSHPVSEALGSAGQMGALAPYVSLGFSGRTAATGSPLRGGLHHL